uniref:C2H2-type domain-containing protein n=2 Tax=Clytia hemisphaerica TaxID=252671 RepID=A0A7M5XL15_9CNID
MFDSNDTVSGEPLSTIEILIEDGENNEESEEAGPSERKGKNSAKYNGFTMFYQKICNSIGENAKKDKQKAPSIKEMAKIAAGKWRALDDNRKKDWNRSAQLERENRDCDVSRLECERCKNIFSREKDKRYHEQFCYEVECPECHKKFRNGILMKKHLKTHTKTFECAECSK